MDLLINAFKKKEIQKLIDFLKSTEHSDTDIESSINKSLKCISFIEFHNNKKREEKNIFLEDSIQALERDGLKSSSKTIKETLQFIKDCEEIFDKIKKELQNHKIDKNFAWNLIRYQSESIEKLRRDFKIFFLKKENGLAFLNSGRRMAKNSFGKPFDIDLSIQSIVKSTSTTLKLIAFEEKMFDNFEVLILEESNRKEKIEDEEILIIINLALAWNTLEDYSIRSLLFDSIPNKKIKDIIENTVNIDFFHRDESQFETLERVSMVRLNKKIYQYSMPSEGMHQEIVNYIILEQLFCIKLDEDETIYNGLTIFEWITLYNNLKNLKTEENIISFHSLARQLSDPEISVKTALHFINEILFSKKSADLFDSPLINIGNENLYINKEILTSINVPLVILSQFSTKNIKPDISGENFENKTISTLKEKFITCGKLKFREDSEYQYDALLILDNKIFIFECKNNSIYFSNPKRTFDYKCEQEKNIEQIKRLKAGIEKYPSHIQDKFNIELKNYEIIPIILNNTPFSWKGEINGVYCSNSSSLARFLEDRNFYYKASILNKRTNERKSIRKIMARQWEGQSPSANDLIRHLKDPIQLIAPLLSTKFYNVYYKINDDVRFAIRSFHTDEELMKKNEIEVFNKKARNIRRNSR